MQTASIPLTVILCGAAVMMVSGTLARLEVAPPLPEAALVDDEDGVDGELEGEPPSLAGDLLVAAPDLDDPYFEGTAVYLLAHDQSGAIGLVLNRPRAGGGRDPQLFDGGPVGRDRVIALHGDPRQGVEVEPGVYAWTDPATIDSVLAGGTFGRVFVGYAGWGPGQLERELAEGAWRVGEATAITVLGVPPPADCPTPY